MTPEPFRLVAFDNEGHEIDIGKISNPRSLKQLEQSTVDVSESIDFRKEISFSCELKPSKEFEDYFRYLVYKKWNYAVLQQLTIICDPRRLECLKVPRGGSMASFFMVAFILKDSIEHLDSYLSEYQYLNPLF